MLRALTRRLLKLLLWLMLASALLVLVLRWVPPPGTALMIERKIESWGSSQSIELKRQWRPWNELPDHLKMAVIAAEDQKFAEHWGFDVGAIQAALAHNQSGGSLRGASTLSQQVAKNLFLWSGRSWLRKGLEAWFTALIELFWSKERILEVYLNSVEWGDGIFGAEAAAQHSFRRRRPLPQSPAGQPAGCRAAQPAALERRSPEWLRDPARGVDSPADEPARRQPLPQPAQAAAPRLVATLAVS